MAFYTNFVTEFFHRHTVFTRRFILKGTLRRDQKVIFVKSPISSPVVMLRMACGYRASMHSYLQQLPNLKSRCCFLPIFNLKKVLVSGPKRRIQLQVSEWLELGERIVEMTAPARTSFKKKLPNCFAELQNFI